jgi:hypothetical protein
MTIRPHIYGLTFIYIDKKHKVQHFNDINYAIDARSHCQFFTFVKLLLRKIDKINEKVKK